MSITKNLNIETRGVMFSATKYGKFFDDLVFNSPFRCAEYIMSIENVDNWFFVMDKYAVVAVTLEDNP